MKVRLVTFGAWYFVLLLVIIGLSLYATYDYVRLRSTVKGLLAHNSTNVMAATNMLKAVGEMESAQVLLLNGFDERVNENFALSRERFLSSHRTASKGCAIPHECGILDTIRTTSEMYLSLSETFMVSSRARTGQAYAAFLNMLSLEQQLRALCLRLLDYNQTRIVETNLRIGETARRGAVLAVISATALAAALIVGLNVQLRREVIRPTQRLRQTLRLIRSGNLAPKIDITAGGELAELYAEFNKMTERLRAYETLNIQQIIAEKRKAEAVVESLNEPVVVADDRNRLILMNRAAIRLLGVADAAWTGQPLQQALPEGRLRSLLADPDPSTEPDYWIPVERDGETRYYRPHRTTASEDGGRVRFRVTLFQDVTAYRTLDRMKSDFIATVSHEFRTPLHSMGMTVDILAREVVGPVNARQQELLASAREDARRLGKLVKDLLDLSRLESGRLTLKKEWIDFRVLAAEVLAPLDLVLKEKRLALTLDVQDGLPRLWGDPQQLSWILANLVSNAVRHTPEGGAVGIVAAAEGGAVRVTVTDTGKGLSPEEQETVFDKFVQIKGPAESTPGSVGLGLAIAKEAVEAHGGTIGVASVSGRGAAFHFRLPLPKPGETA